MALALFGAWTAFALLSSTHFFLGKAASDASASFADVAAHVVVFYWTWALVTPAVVGLARRAGAETGVRRWLLVAAGGVIVPPAHGVLYLAAVRLLGIEPAIRATVAQLGDHLLRHGGGDLATYGLLLGAVALYDSRRLAHERALAASALEARLARADLEILRWQLQPHFLFNALNTVSTLVIRRDAEAAERAVGLISRYLRGALARRADAMVTLAEELAIVDGYVQIEALRADRALRIVRHVADEALGQPVPGLLLQPLVENAIHHGTDAREGAAVAISAAIEGERLVIRVIDPGTGRPPPPGDASSANGFGLRYVRERLRYFYGEAASLELALTPSDTVATVAVPADLGATAVVPDTVEARVVATGTPARAAARVAR